MLARYLQTISALPSMAILALGNLIGLLVLSPLILPKISVRVLRSHSIWLFSLVVVLRAITNLLAARFAPAIYVQLITLMTPFIVALLSTTLFRERLPLYTFQAITLSLLGALLMMSGAIDSTGMALVLEPTHWLGIAMALGSSLCLALYMLLVPRTVKDNVPAEAVFFVQLITLTLTSGAISLLIGEDWSRWMVIGLSDWLVFGGFTLGVLLGANLGQIASLRHLGASLVSSMMAWRLISTLLLAALLLGEQLTSLWQMLGALIVLVTITFYLWRQSK
ncbi:MAG: DMT family transporter [Chloroflexales bacterium]|nr:DMT family transporter [Chloroflexales bacterium]